MDAVEEDQPFRVGGTCEQDQAILARLALDRQKDKVHALQAYASNYVGHAKMERLLFIAEKKQGTAFGDDALRLALEELSQVSNAFGHVLSHTACPVQYSRNAPQSDNTQKYQGVATCRRQRNQ